MEGREIIDKVIDINKKIKAEETKENVDKKQITKLMFEQMLHGLGLNSTMF